MTRTSRRSVLAALLVAGLGLAQSAWAYLDPGSGSFILNAILTALIGSALAIKMFWQRVKAFFARLFSRTARAEQKAD